VSLFQEPKLAFEGVVASELYPCVLFYSSNPGEKVPDTLHSYLPSNDHHDGVLFVKNGAAVILQTHKLP